MTLIDYIVLGVYLLLICGITWHFRKTGGDHRDFFLAGCSFGAIPVGLSVMVTTFSAVNYLALPSEVFAHGLYVLASLPAFFLAAIPITRYWIPYFNKLGCVSIYAFLERRFDLRVRMLCSLLFLIWRIFWMAIALYASAKIMHIITGLDFFMLLLVSGILATGYSAIGGMKAVVWSDVLQFGVLFSSIAAAVYLAYSQAPMQQLSSIGKLQPFFPPDWSYLSFNPMIRISLWSGLIGSTVAFMTRFGGDQMVMQRYLSAKSIRAAQRGLWLNGIASTISLGLLALFGLALAAFAKNRGIPAATPAPKVIAMLLKSFPLGMTGLVGAGLMAATMSSIDSGLNSCSATIAIDFLERLKQRRISNKVITVVLALPIMALAAFVLPALNRNQTLFVILNKTVNAMGTPLLAVMICALFWKRVKCQAVFYGTLSGFVLTLLFSLLVNSIALHYYAVFSLIATFAAVAVLNLIFRDDIT